MDGQEYLNQISASSRPVKNSKSGLLSSKFFIVGMIGVVVLIIIIILGAILSGGNKTGGEKNLSAALILHLRNTSEEIEKYQPYVKSSALRSNGGSLRGILTDTEKKLTEFATAKYGFKDKDINKKILAQANTEKDGLESELFEAKINGILDRIFAHKMAYEITMFMTEENKLLNTTKNDTLKETLTTSYDSLENLYDKFNDFSETK